MRKVLAFFILASIKTVSTIFYRCRFKWLTPIPKNPWTDIRLMVFLNHTSLYEPLFVQILPYRYLWFLSNHFNIPGADITLNRPIVGAFWKLMIPNISSISRKKDKTWENYLSTIRREDVVMIAPEGRMKRTSGLDKNGKPMTVRGGIADIIDTVDSGHMLLCFSGGLHHVQAPGQHLPKLFKTISMNLARIDIQQYKSQFTGSTRERKIKIIDDLQKRLENDCPQ